MTGSVRVARQAAKKQAASEAIAITGPADTNASGSRGLTLYSRFPSGVSIPAPLPQRARRHFLFRHKDIMGNIHMCRTGGQERDRDLFFAQGPRRIDPRRAQRGNERRE